jgi:hypothetical protein
MVERRHLFPLWTSPFWLLLLAYVFSAAAIAVVVIFIAGVSQNLLLLLAFGLCAICGGLAARFAIRLALRRLRDGAR